jgi:hypothetical protein
MRISGQIVAINTEWFRVITQNRGTLWKDGLNSDVQQFLQYQQNQQSLLALIHWTWKKNITTCDFTNPGPGMWQAQNVEKAKPVNWISTLPSW